MRYLVIALFGLFASVAAVFLLNVYVQKKDTPELPVQLKNFVILLTTKRRIYVVVSIICVIAVGTYLLLMFPAIHLLKVMKLQVLIALLSAFCYTDLKYRLVPNQIILIGLIIRVCFLPAEFIWQRNNFFDILKQAGLGVLIIGGFFILCALISKNGFGMGDVKLFIMMATYQGLTGALPAIGTSFVFCFVVAIILIALRKKTRKDYIPLVPFVFAGSLISVALIGC